MNLLVSVIDAAEALEALRGGADVIDIKNPAEGALGAASPVTIRAVRSVVPPALAVSAALGDMPDLPGTAALAAVGAALAGASMVKVGLYGTRTPEAAFHLLSVVSDALRSFAPAARLVACAYADAAGIGAIQPHELPRVAAAAGCSGAMVDTFTKGQGSLFRYMAPPEVANFVACCRSAGLTSAVAGSLAGDELMQAAALGADIVGVRSAACTGGDRRHGRVAAAHVAEVRRQLRLAPAEVS